MSRFFFLKVCDETAKLAAYRHSYGDEALRLLCVAVMGGKHLFGSGATQIRQPDVALNPSCK